MSDHEDSYHEGSEQTELTTLIVMILSLLLIGVFMFALTWAMAV